MLEGNTGAQGAGQGSQFRGWVSSFRQGLRRCKGFLGAGPGYHIHNGHHHDHHRHLRPHSKRLQYYIRYTSDYETHPPPSIDAAKAAAGAAVALAAGGSGY